MIRNIAEPDLLLLIRNELQNSRQIIQDILWV